MNEVIYGVLARWWSARDSPANIGARFIDTLDRLQRVSPLMKNWQVWDGAVSLLPLAEARGQMAKLTANGVARYDDRRDPDDGYSVVADSAEVQGEFNGDRSAKVSIRAGSIRTNDASIGFGGNVMAPDMDLMTYPLFRGTVDVIASNWPCPWVEAYATPKLSPIEPVTLPLNMDKLREPPPSRDERFFPWILYLSAPFADDLKSRNDLICEPTPGGGVVLSAVADRLDLADPEHVRRSRLLQVIIAERLPPETPPRWHGMAVPDARVGPY